LLSGAELDNKVNGREDSPVIDDPVVGAVAWKVLTPNIELFVAIKFNCSPKS
jgi:hypothetical protein